MSETYWIDSSAASVDELLRRSGARREWIEEAHWLDPSPNNPADSFPICFRWPAAPPQDHALLHLLGQALASGERKLILIGQAAAGALLAGPKAVGRYNLSPKARLAARFTHPGGDFTGWLNTIAAHLERVELDPNDVAWLATDRSPEHQTMFARAGWLENQGTLLNRMIELVGWLEENHAPAGLLFSLPPDGPWLATLVERV